MQLSDTFLLRVLFLLTPGIVGLHLYRILTGREYQQAWRAFTDALLFAMGSYITLAAVVSWRGSTPNPLESFLVPAGSLPWQYIAWSCAISAPLAFAAAWVHRTHGINWLGERLDVSRRVSDADLWQVFLESVDD